MKSATIVIPIFDDTGDTVLDVLAAAKFQTYPTTVCVMVQAGSKTPEILAKHFTKDIFFYAVKERGFFTLIDMLNLAIKENKSDYISFVPQTCVLNFIKTEYQMQQMQEAKKFQISATGGISVQKRLGKILSIDEKISNEFRIIEGKNLIEVLKKSVDKISYHYPLTAGLLYDRKIFDEYGVFNNKYPLLFEIEFLIRVLKDHDVQYVGNMLYTDINDEMTYQSYFDQAEYSKQFAKEKQDISKI